MQNTSVTQHFRTNPVNNRHIYTGGGRFIRITIPSNGASIPFPVPSIPLGLSNNPDEGGRVTVNNNNNNNNKGKMINDAVQDVAGRQRPFAPEVDVKDDDDGGGDHQPSNDDHDNDKDDHDDDLRVDLESSSNSSFSCGMDDDEGDQFTTVSDIAYGILTSPRIMVAYMTTTTITTITTITTMRGGWRRRAIDMVIVVARGRNVAAADDDDDNDDNIAVIIIDGPLAPRRCHRRRGRRGMMPPPTSTESAAGAGGEGRSRRTTRTTTCNATVRTSPARIYDRT